VTLVLSWYRAYSCLGNSASVVAQIATAIERLNLSRFVRSLRVEKRAKGNFYLFLEFDSKVRGQLPPDVEGSLKAVPCLKQPQPGFFEFEQISKMVGADLEVHEYARRLNFWKIADPPADDPFDAPGEELACYDSAQIDQLLLWLSAHGNVSWPRFNTAFRELVTEKTNGTLNQVVRRLKLLGHVETSNDGKSVCIAPSTITLISPGVWLHSGQRDSALFRSLSSLGRLNQIGLPAGPSRVTLIRQEEPSTEMLETLSSQGTTLQSSISTRLSELLQPVGAWAKRLPTLDGLKASLYEVRVFDGKAFSEGSFNSRQSGFYELWPQKGRLDRRNPDFSAFYNAETQVWHRGDWYGLRFLALCQVSRCTTRYNSSSGEFAVPVAWRWPELYERCLVLSSGMLPDVKAGWLIYSSIPAAVVNDLTTKLMLNNHEEQ
ncbi:unnamed protein product, partial [Phaeothamnion confervicola]